MFDKEPLGNFARFSKTPSREVSGESTPRGVLAISQGCLHGGIHYSWVKVETANPIAFEATQISIHSGFCCAVEIEMREAFSGKPGCDVDDYTVRVSVDESLYEPNRGNQINREFVDDLLVLKFRRQKYRSGVIDKNRICTDHFYYHTEIRLQEIERGTRQPHNVPAVSSVDVGEGFPKPASSASYEGDLHKKRGRR